MSKDRDKDRDKLREEIEELSAEVEDDQGKLAGLVSEYEDRFGSYDDE